MHLLYKLSRKMIEYYRGDPKRIQHFLKVYELAKLIATGENVDEKTMLIIEVAAMVHDIGIKRAEEFHGECGGKLQKTLGPPIAKEMLSDVEFPAEITERVCFLVSRHHTYTDIDGDDLQILIEADFLVNLFEDNSNRDSILTTYEKIFKTKTGKEICCQMFNIV